MATQLDQLYETDFYAWTEDQAAALRSLLQQRWNGPLDLANLAEEVEDLGKAERNAVRSQVRRIIEHCLKLEYSPASDPRSGWRVSIDDARDQIEDSLTDTIRQDVEQRLPRLYTQALRKVRETLILSPAGFGRSSAGGLAGGGGGEAVPGDVDGGGA